MHSVEYNYCFRSFSNVRLKNANRNLAHQLRNSNDYIVPAALRESFKKSPLHSFPTIWNSLGPVKFQTNRLTFKLSLTYELLQSIVADNPWKLLTTPNSTSLFKSPFPTPSPLFLPPSCPHLNSTQSPVQEQTLDSFFLYMCCHKLSSLFSLVLSIAVAPAPLHAPPPCPRRPDHLPLSISSIFQKIPIFLFPLS